MARNPVHLTAARARRVRTVVRERDLCDADIARRGADASLTRTQLKRSDLYAEAANLVGAFRAGEEASLSTSHDEHLECAFR